MKRIGIRLRLFLAMMAVISGFLVLTYGVMDGLVDRFLEAEIANSLERARKACTSFTAVRKAVLIDQARSVAQVPHLRAVLDTPDVDEQTVSYTIATLSEAVGASLLFITDGRGHLLASTRPDWKRQPNEAVDSSFEQVLAGEDHCCIWEYGDDRYLVAVSPVLLDSSVLGLLGLGYPLEDHIEDLHGATGLDVTVVRGDEVLASASDESFISPLRNAAAWSSVALERSSPLSVGGREHMATAIPIEEGSVRLILSRPLDQVLMYFRRARTEILFIGLAIAALGLLVSQWISERTARPLRELRDAANAFARGELSVEVRVRTEDEIGMLGRAFNGMARQLAALMQKAIQKAKAAEEANEAKSAFLATISHEIRTPLNGVLGFTEQVLGTPLSNEQRDHLLLVQRSGQDLLAIIDDILDFAKLEAGQLRLERIEFHLPTFLRRAIDSLRPAIDAKGLSIDTVVEEDVPHSLVGPASRLRQIVLNYVSNAVKFTAQGSITIRASLVSQTESDAIIRIEVRDTGIGISSDRLSQLFKPFSQLNSGANREYGGTGLGLAICKDLAGLMNGEVGVNSAPGAGSAFWFTVRLAKRSAAPGAEQAPALAARQTASAQAVSSGGPRERDPETFRRRSGQRILVAEDNRINQKVTGVILSKAGWPHVIAENGRQAVDLALAELFDLILMDCQMPTMDGFEATRRIRESEQRTDRHVPIIALTANALEGDRAACLAAGMDDFVGKPFKAAELEALLDRWLGVKRRVAG